MVGLGMVINDRYEIVEKVGTGGMADVFRAKDRRLNRFVAIKFLKQEYSQDAKFVTKFRGEAQSVAGLSHPNIVGIYDVGEDGALYYIVMEYIEGITLKRYIENKGKLSVKETISIALQIANGLNAAHNHSIVHRDIKPQNILIAKDGTVKVTDFGIAKAASSNTITSNAMGSVHYISPEQARGGFSDEKSDIYSLGVTMYEMLTGTLPFTGDSTVAVALSHVQDEAVPIAAVDATVPNGLSKIVEKCMQKRQEQRYLSAAALIADMKMFLSDPSGSYGNIESLVPEDSRTKVIPVDEVRELRNSLASEAAELEKADSEEEEGDVDPKLEKALVIGSIVVAIIIGLVIIVMLAKFLGLFGPSDGGTPEETPAASASVTPGVTSGTESEQLIIPDVKELDPVAARSKLEGAGFIVDESDEKQESDEIPKGMVIGTVPEAGEEVDKETSVRIIVSNGNGKIKVPNVYNFSLEDAQTELTKKFKVATAESPVSSNAEKDKVAYTVPGSGERVERGTTITIYISKGPEDEKVAVPDLTGLSKFQAQEKLYSLGLKLGTSSEGYSDTVKAGGVCKQSPKANKNVKKGTAINLTFSLGPKTTYSYIGKITIQNPFINGEESGRVSIVLFQDGQQKPIFNGTLRESDFPRNFDNIKGYSDSDGTIVVSVNGTKVWDETISFRKVAE